MKPLKFARTVFVDRSFGGHRLAQMLQRIGFDTHAHKEFFKEDEDDHVWIPDISSRGWVIFTSDARIARDPLNIKAVLDSRAQIVMTSDNNHVPEVWGAAFTVGRIRLDEILEANPGPVFISIGSAARDHAKQVKQNLTHPAGATLPTGSDPQGDAVGRRAAIQRSLFPHLKF